MAIFICKIIIGLILFYFLPGYLFIKTFLRRNNLSTLEKFTFALFTSPVIFIAPFCLITYFAKLSLDHILLLILLEIIILAVINTKNYRKLTISNIRIDNAGWVFILGFIIFISLSLSVQLTSTRMQWSYHGTDHGSIVYQIINDIIPPTNPMISGYPITTYWMYHLKLAILSKSLNISPLQASVLNNVYAMVSTLLILYCLSRYIISRWYLRSLLPFFIFSVSNVLGPIYLLCRILTKRELDVRPPDFIANKFITIDSIYSWMRAIFAKFLNFNGFPLGFLYICASLLSIILILNKKKNCYFILLFVSLLGAIMFHATSSLALYLSLAVLFLCILFTKNYERKEKKNTILKLILGSVIVFLISFPYIFPASHYLATKKISLTHSFNNIKHILLYYWPLFPFYIYGIITLLKKQRLDFMFLSIGSIFILLAASLLELAGGIQYKLMHLLAIPYGIVILLLIDDAIKRFNKKLFTRFLICIVSLFSILMPVSVSYIYLNKDWASDKKYVSRGINVELSSKESDLAKTYFWIRNNTDGKSVLVEPGRQYDETILEFLSQRRAYVAYGKVYTEENKLFYKKWGEIERLFTPGEKKIDVLKELQSIKEGAYLVLSKEDNPLYFNSLKNEFSQLNKYLRPVFQTPTIKVYKIIKSSG